MNLEEKQKLYVENEKLAYFTLNRYFPLDAADEDIQQDAKLALWKACLRYEPGPIKFTTFAVRAIRQKIMTLYLEKHRLKRGGYDKDLELDALECPMGTRPSIPFDWVDYRGFLNAIQPMSAEIVKMTAAGYTRKEIAKVYGVSHQAIDQRLQRTRDTFARYI